MKRSIEALVVGFVLTILVIWSGGASLSAQPVVIVPNPAVQAHGDTTVTLVTCYPGKDIYELEGHTALRINGPGFDIAVNYGVFDFDSPNFLYRFVKGETDYMAVAAPWEHFLYQYYDDGRRVEEQLLDLSAEQKRRLVAAVTENLKPENRVYRYNYVKDNCATRPLAAIEAGIGDSLDLTFPDFGVENRPATFRDVMRYYHRNYPWYQFGIDLALGSGIDYPLSAREYAFAPVLLHAQIAKAVMPDGKPLVGATRVDNDVPAFGAVEGPTPWWATPLAVCWAFFVVALVITLRDIRSGSVTRWFDSVYYLALGLAGILLAFLVFVSVHEATSPNYLLIWINPLCLIPAIFIWLKRCKIVLNSYQIVNFVAVFALLVSWYWLPQSANPAFLPLVLVDLMRSGSYIYLNISKFGSSHK